MNGHSHTPSSLLPPFQRSTRSERWATSKDQTQASEWIIYKVLLLDISQNSPCIEIQVCYSFLFIILAFNHPPIQSLPQPCPSPSVISPTRHILRPCAMFRSTSTNHILSRMCWPSMLFLTHVKEISLSDYGMQLDIGLIIKESDASCSYYLYFSSFIMDSSDIPSYFHYNKFDMSNEEFTGRQWSDINAIKEFKRREVSSFKILNKPKISDMFRTLF